MQELLKLIEGTMALIRTDSAPKNLVDGVGKTILLVEKLLVALIKSKDFDDGVRKFIKEEITELLKECISYIKDLYKEIPSGAEEGPVEQQILTKFITFLDVIELVVKEMSRFYNVGKYDDWYMQLDLLELPNIDDENLFDSHEALHKSILDLEHNKLEALESERNIPSQLSLKTQYYSCQEFPLNQMDVDTVKPLETDNTSALTKKSAKSGGLMGNTFGSKRKFLMRWCNEKTQKYGIQVKDFSVSWASGRALVAIIYSFRKDLIEGRYINNESQENTLIYGVKVARGLGVRCSTDFVQMCMKKRANQFKIIAFVEDLYSCLESTGPK